MVRCKLVEGIAICLSRRALKDWHYNMGLLKVNHSDQDVVRILDKPYVAWIVRCCMRVFCRHKPLSMVVPWVLVDCTIDKGRDESNSTRDPSESAMIISLDSQMSRRPFFDCYNKSVICPADILEIFAKRTWIWRSENCLNAWVNW